MHEARRRKQEFINWLGGIGRAGVKLALSQVQHGNMKAVTGKGERDWRNMAEFAHRQGFSKKMFFANVQHGPAALFLAEQYAEFSEHSLDAVVTNDFCVCLVMPFADCPPLLLVDAEKEIMALVHCGWKSVAAGILENTLANFMLASSRMENIKAFIGPRICPAHYEFGAAEAEKYFAIYPQCISAETCTGKVQLDLAGIIEAKLMACGVLQKKIYACDVCTVENEKYFSARRDQMQPPNVQACAMFAQLRKKRS